MFNDGANSAHDGALCVHLYYFSIVWKVMISSIGLSLGVFGWGIMNFWYLTCVCSILNFTYSWYIVQHHSLRMLLYRCTLSVEDMPLTALSQPYLFSFPRFSRLVLFLLSYHMWFLCVLSESLGPTYERERLCFEHWCNSLNADFSLHPFSCKSHGFIFPYGGKYTTACLCRILPSSVGPVT